MKKILNLRVSLAIFLAAAPLAATAQTTFFNDTFNNGSTLTNLSPASPTINSTSYQLVTGKTLVPPSLASHDLKFSLASTSGAGIAVQALFTNSPVVLTTNGDYVQMTVVFTNTAGLLTANGVLD